MRIECQNILIVFHFSSFFFTFWNPYTSKMKIWNTIKISTATFNLNKKKHHKYNSWNTQKKYTRSVLHLPPLLLKQACWGPPVLCSPPIFAGDTRRDATTHSCYAEVSNRRFPIAAATGNSVCHHCRLGKTESTPPPDPHRVRHLPPSSCPS